MPAQQYNLRTPGSKGYEAPRVTHHVNAANCDLNNTLQLRAFNLLPGAGVLLSQTGDFYKVMVREAVVMKIIRNADSEAVHLVLRFTDSEALFGTDDDLPCGSRFGDTFSMSLDYLDPVTLFGLCVNPDNTDDADLGVS